MSMRTRVQRLLRRESACCPECGSVLPAHSPYPCDVCGYDLVRRVRDRQIHTPTI
jgi:hypothetical protein